MAPFLKASSERSDAPKAPSERSDVQVPEDDLTQSRPTIPSLVAVACKSIRLCEVV